MAEEAENTSPETAPAKGGPGILVMMLVAVMSVAAGAGGAYVALDLRAGADAEAAQSAADGDAEEAAAPASYKDRLLSLEPFIVNIGGDGYSRFLKLKIELEADSLATREELEGRRPQIRDTTILLLSSKRLADVSEFEGKALLKDDIRTRIDEILPEGRVQSVLITEFVIQ